MNNEKRYYWQPEINLESDHKDKILNLEKDLKEKGIISELIFIPDIVVTGNDIKSVRLAAARHNADAVLIIKSATDLDHYLNFGSILYFTLVGAWIVPGSHIDSLAIVNGAMWDVRNEYLYFTAESEGLVKKMGPSMVLNERKIRNDAIEQAISKFQSEILWRLENISGKK